MQGTKHESKGNDGRDTLKQPFKTRHAKKDFEPLRKYWADEQDHKRPCVLFLVHTFQTCDPI